MDTPFFMVKGPFKKTFESIAELLKKRGESEDLIERFKRFSKQRAIADVRQALRTSRGFSKSKVNSGGMRFGFHLKIAGAHSFSVRNIPSPA